MGFLSLGAIHGQENTKAPKAKPDPKAPTATLVRYGWAKTGELILAVKIQAGGQTLELGSFGGKAGENGRGEELNIFSMGTSVLTDTYSQTQIHALPHLPKKPFFGNMEGMILLESGNSLTFGVAFPRPPDPPTNKDGTQRPFNLRLQPPLGIAPIEFEIPYKPIEK